MLTAGVARLAHAGQEAEVRTPSARLDAVGGEPAVTVYPERQAYYGDLHLHTSYSLDAYLAFGARIDPDGAYQFARGEPVKYADREVKRATPPLDFLAVTDHAEWLGVMNTLADPNSALSRGELGEKVRAGKNPEIWPILGHWPTHPKAQPGVDTEALLRSNWQRTIDAANRYYQPGKFTTFIAYEWTVNFGERSYHLHRNVIFRGNTAPRPFSALDSEKPEDLWAYLDDIRKQGHEALAIPHNPNGSNGVAFDWVGSEGRRIDQEYAERRAANEPLVEISQHKGTSETHPVLSPNDEFADFELMAIGMPGFRRDGGYVRDALGRGLALASQAGGVDPFKYGFVGASDFHTALSDSAENGFAGFAGWWGPIDLTKKGESLERRVTSLTGADPAKITEHMKFMAETSSGGLTGAWAESNTREAIYAAFRRRETFATSGSRLRFRFFGGWAFDSKLLERRDWVKRAYAQGVPMGGDLPLRPNKKRAPQFALWAAKDPEGANLDRLQVVKVWLEDGKHLEKIYDVALSNGRKVDPKTGRAPPVGNTVDVDRATYINSIGAAELTALWRDPDFHPDAPAVYYLRVLEIPTPRWSTVVAAKTGKPRPGNVPATLQERGWSSPIWFKGARQNR